MRLNCNNINVTGTLAVNIVGIAIVTGSKSIVNAIGNIDLIGKGFMNAVFCGNPQSELIFNGNNLSVSGGFTAGTASSVISAQLGAKITARCNDIAFTLDNLSSQLYCSAIAVTGNLSALYIKCNIINVFASVTSPYIACCQLGRSNGSGKTDDATLQVECYEATINGANANTYAIQSQNNNAGCRGNFRGRFIVKGGAFADCDAVNLLDDGTHSDAKIILDDATLIPKGIGFSVSSSIPNNIYIYGGCQSTQPVDANTTELVNTIVVNALVI
jgi:hypothetical protein